MTATLAAPVQFFDWQQAALDLATTLTDPYLRMCLYFKTGAGKSITALALLAQDGIDRAVVITPPATFKQWHDVAAVFDIEVETISHAKFREKDYKLSRDTAVIADEFHLFGGHKGQGWKKLDTMAKHLRAPLVLASATPNYNDAERVYCIQHVLDPLSCKGGYIEFLYRECLTEANRFGREPKVLGFRNHDSAAEYLAALPRVAYLPDDLVYQIQDIEVPSVWPAEAETYGLNRRTGRIMASQIEERHARVNLNLVDDSGMVRDYIYNILTDLVGAATTPSLVFAAHSTVADALGASLHAHRVKHAVVHGGTPAKKKAAYIETFKDGVLDVLVGTASLATGTDGLDKMCDTLIILDDTDDDALRRQLVGRIMPRGEGGDVAVKQVYRLVPA